MERDKDPVCRTELTQEVWSAAVWGHTSILDLFNSGVLVRLSIVDSGKT